MNKVVKALVSIGYVVSNQKGSHIVMRLVDSQRFTSVFGCRKNQTLIVVPAKEAIRELQMLQVVVAEKTRH
jgi:hypothetical protein